MKKINDCPDCAKANSIFCSTRCQRNYMARQRYWRNKAAKLTK